MAMSKFTAYLYNIKYVYIYIYIISHISTYTPFIFIHMIKLTCVFFGGGPPSLSDHMGTPFGPFDSSKASCSEARCHPSSASSGGISRQVSTKATRIGSAHFGGGSAHQGLQMFANTWI